MALEFLFCMSNGSFDSNGDLARDEINEYYRIITNDPIIDKIHVDYIIQSAPQFDPFDIDGSFKQDGLRWHISYKYHNSESLRRRALEGS
jgi:hypothetical protein